jgi:phage-related protein
MESAFTGMANQIQRAFSPLTYFFKAVEGFMTTLEPLADLAETIGTILGQSISPIVQEIVGFITPFLPVLVALSQILQPILLFFFNLLSPLGKIITFIDILSDLTGFDILTEIPNLLTNVFSDVALIVSNFFTVTIPGFFRDMIISIGTSISNMWNDLGTRLTGGGADKYGWW